MPTDDLRSIADERAIERALVRLARAMDDRDWATLADIIADDAIGDSGSGRLEGSAAIIDLIRGYLDSCGPTQHLLGNVLVDVSGEAAVSVAYVHDLHLSAREPQTTFHTLGDYRDRWERRDGAWRLVERIKRNRATVGSLQVFDASPDHRT
ncbi:nuclear transport factor 2 family protein [Mycobacterium sp. MUNTM1]